MSKPTAQDIASAQEPDFAIRRAMTSSAISKVVTLAVQILVLPLAIHAVGTERFGVYVVVTGLLSWLTLSSAGLFPGLTREVARNPSDLPHIRRLFRHALLLVIALTGLTAAAAVAALQLIPTTTLFGNHFEPFAAEMKLAATAALVCILMQVIGGAAEAVRTGMQQQHVNNGWGIVGNLLSLPLLLVCAHGIPELYFLVIATHGALAFSKLLNLAQLLKLLHRQPADKTAALQPALFQQLAGTGLILLLGQIAILMTQQGSTYLVGYISGPDAAASFSVMLRITVIAGGLIVMVSQPLGAALTAAAANGNLDWIDTKARRLAWLTMAYALLAGAVIATAGPTLVRFWLNAQIEPEIELFWLTGLYFVTVVWNHLHYVALIALGETFFPTALLFVEAATMALLALLLIGQWQASGGMFALLAAAVLISATLNHRRLRYRLTKLSVGKS